MAESLREQVRTAVTTVLLDEIGDYRGDADLVAVASAVVQATFAALAGARPCVTCGKGIGPAKVAKGYVQCYGCRGTTALDRAEMQAAHDATSLPDWHPAEVMWRRRFPDVARSPLYDKGWADAMSAMPK